MSDFAERGRFTLDAAQLCYIADQSPCITHPFYNEDDDTYSFMSHIVCEHCDYCDYYNELYKITKYQGWPSKVAVAKPDPYEIQNLLQWYDYNLYYAFYGSDIVKPSWNRK